MSRLPHEHRVERAPRPVVRASCLHLGASSVPPESFQVECCREPPNPLGCAHRSCVPCDICNPRRLQPDERNSAESRDITLTPLESDRRWIPARSTQGRESENVCDRRGTDRRCHRTDVVAYFNIELVKHVPAIPLFVFCCVAMTQDT